MLQGTCAICGLVQLAYGNWFLVVENPWQDRLRISHWDHRLAADPEVSHACGSVHLREILIRWIMRREMPSSVPLFPPKTNRLSHFSLWDLAGQAQPIGELAVHRCAAYEDPEIMKSALDAVCMLVENVSQQRQPSREEFLLAPSHDSPVPLARSASA